MKIRDFIKILLDADPNGEIAIDVGEKRVWLKEEHIIQPQGFSMNKDLKIDISK